MYVHTAPPSRKKAKTEPVTTPTSSGSVDYSKMKVAELKAQLEAQGMDTTGKKAELVARLQGAGMGGIEKCKSV